MQHASNVTWALRTLIAAAALVAVTLGSAGRGSDAVGATMLKPRTLATIPGDVDAFAQDGDFLAWARGADLYGGRGFVEVHSVSTSSRKVVGRTRHPDTGGPSIPLYGFALAGTRVLVATHDYSVCSNTYCGFDMYIAGLSAPGFRPVGRASEYSDANGYAYLPPRIPVAGDGSTFAYFATCPSSDECGVVDDAILRITGERHTKVADSSYPTALATDAGRIAAAVLIDRRPARSVVSVWEGTRATRFGVGGQVLALSMSESRAALLIRSGGQTSIEVRRTSDGSLARRVSVPVSAQPSISISSETVVVHVGRAIQTIDARTGKVSSIALVQGTAIGLSIEGRRVAWAERVKGAPDRIRAVTLGP
jgi:hypothetical protein